MESRNVLSQTNSISKWMPVLSCAQPGEYTYKNISFKVEKYNSTFYNTYTGKSLSKALILGSTNPQYDK